MEDTVQMSNAGEEPGGWDLQRQISRVDADRREDMARIERRHQQDKLELLTAMEKLGARVEQAVRESTGVPLTTWEAHNRAIDSELSQLRQRVESVQRVVVGTLLTMIAGGVAVATAGALGG